METIIAEISKDTIDKNIISQAGKIISQGGLVAFPTETVYGLGGDAMNPEASKKIYAAKGRPSDNPLIIHISNLEQLEKIAENVDDRVRKMAQAFWPGPLTMVFKKKKEVPYSTTGGLETVAVRMPDNKIALSLIEESGTVIAAPSANISGRPSPTTGKRVVEDLKGRVEMILDAGEVEIGLESSIVDMTGAHPTILRPGAVTMEMVEEILGKTEVDLAVSRPESVGEGYKPKAPGMKYRHYAPEADLTIFNGNPESVVAEMVKRAKQSLSQNKTPGIITSEEKLNFYLEELKDYKDHFLVISLGKREDDKEIAKNLYEALRKFDDAKVDEIFSEAFEEGRLGRAIMNRFTKAAGNNIIKCE